MFANLNLSVSSNDEAKEAIFKAVSVGYNIIAISKAYNNQEGIPTCEKWKIVNCGTYEINKNESDIDKNKKNNYYLNCIQKKENFEEFLLKINLKIKENIVLVNQNNSFCAKNVCEDFLYYNINICNEINEKNINNILKILPSSNYFISKNSNTYVLNRLNLNYEDLVTSTTVPNFTKCNFDLIAVKISTIEELRFTLKNFKCDIISFDASTHIRLMKKTDIKLIMDSGVFIEIPLFNKYTETNMHNKKNNTVKHIKYVLCYIPLNRIIFTCEDLYKDRIIDPFNLLKLFSNFHHNINYKRLINCVTNNPINCLHKASTRRFSNITVFAKAT